MPGDGRSLRGEFVRREQVVFVRGRYRYYYRYCYGYSCGFSIVTPSVFSTRETLDGRAFAAFNDVQPSGHVDVRGVGSANSMMGQDGKV